MTSADSWFFENLGWVCFVLFGVWVFIEKGRIWILRFEFISSTIYEWENLNKWHRSMKKKMLILAGIVFKAYVLSLFLDCAQFCTLLMGTIERQGVTIINGCIVFITGKWKEKEEEIRHLDMYMDVAALPTWLLYPQKKLLWSSPSNLSMTEAGHLKRGRTVVNGCPMCLGDEEICGPPHVELQNCSVYLEGGCWVVWLLLGLYQLTLRALSCLEGSNWGS